MDCLVRSTPDSLPRFRSLDLPHRRRVPKLISLSRSAVDWTSKSANTLPFVWDSLTTNLWIPAAAIRMISGIPVGSCSRWAGNKSNGNQVPASPTRRRSGYPSYRSEAVKRRRKQTSVGAVAPITCWSRQPTSSVARDFLPGRLAHTKPANLLSACFPLSYLRVPSIRSRTLQGRIVTAAVSNAALLFPVLIFFRTGSLILNPSISCKGICSKKVLLLGLDI